MITAPSASPAATPPTLRVTVQPLARTLVGPLGVPTLELTFSNTFLIASTWQRSIHLYAPPVRHTPRSLSLIPPPLRIATECLVTQPS